MSTLWFGRNMYVLPSPVEAIERTGGGPDESSHGGGTEEQEGGGQESAGGEGKGHTHTTKSST